MSKLRKFGQIINNDLTPVPQTIIFSHLPISEKRLNFSVILWKH